MIHGGSDRGEIVARIRRVERAFGWSFLSGPAGEAAEAAKERLLAEIGDAAPAPDPSSPGPADDSEAGS